MKVQDLILPGSRKTVVLPGRGALPFREVSERMPGPSVMLLHGWGASADLNFATLYRPLARQWHLVAPDLRGHGSGIVSREKFSLEACADDAAAMVRSLGIGPVVALGYSMGGPVALLMARRHPDTVAGLVLCATAPRFVTNTWERLALMRFSSLAFSLRSAQENFLPLRYVAPRLLRVLEATGSLARFDATPWLPALKVPASVVVTTEDRLVAPSDQMLLGGIHRTKFFEVPAGHEACITQSGKFVRACEEAIRSVQRRSRSARTPAPAPGSVPLAGLAASTG
jgi:3-oxoadipate enol-lactonase